MDYYYIHHMQMTDILNTKKLNYTTKPAHTSKDKHNLLTHQYQHQHQQSFYSLMILGYYS
jgi:hypothetical protein